MNANTIMKMRPLVIVRMTLIPQKLEREEGEEEKEGEILNHHFIGLAASWQYHCWFGAVFSFLQRTTFKINP
jgi:hypothetical protein